MNDGKLCDYCGKEYYRERGQSFANWNKQFLCSNSCRVGLFKRRREGRLTPLEEAVQNYEEGRMSMSEAIAGLEAYLSRRRERLARRERAEAFLNSNKQVA